MIIFLLIAVVAIGASHFLLSRFYACVQEALLSCMELRLPCFASFFVCGVVYPNGVFLQGMSRVRSATYVFLRYVCFG